MEKKLFNSKLNLISIYYINNVPLPALQKITERLKLYYKCDISYFDSNFFFLKIIWNGSTFKDKNINIVKSSVALTDINLKQTFLLPVAVLINKTLIDFSSFNKLFTFDKNFVLFEEMLSYNNTPVVLFGQLEVFLFSPVTEVFSYIDNL